MKYFAFIIFFISTCLLKAQNLHISSGFNLAGMNIKIENPQSLTSTATNKYSRNSSNFDFINILFEKEINNRVSWKTGFYILKQNAYYIKNEIFLYQGSSFIKSHINDFSLTTINIPFLMTYYMKSGEKLRFDTNIGPYLSAGFPSEGTNHGDLYPFFYGLDLSAGLGSGKWKFTTYFLKGKNFRKSWHPKMRSTNIGINLTRIIQFKKNHDESTTRKIKK